MLWLAKKPSSLTPPRLVGAFYLFACLKTHRASKSAQPVNKDEGFKSGVNDALRGEWDRASVTASSDDKSSIVIFIKVHLSEIDMNLACMR